MSGMTPHEMGYRAFLALGLAARNPYERQIRSQEQWQKGFQKARDEHTRKGPSQ